MTGVTQKMEIIYTGNICNNKCRYCEEPRGIFSPGLEEIKKQIKDSEEIFIKGGEPTIRKDFIEILEYARDKKIRLLTNGRMFSYPAFCKMVIDYIDEFDIKLPSHNRETFKELTGTDSLEQTLKGIVNLLRLGANVRVMVPLTRQNDDEIYETAHQLFHLGVRNMVFELKNTGDKGILPFVSQSANRVKGIIEDFSGTNITVKDIPECLLESYPDRIINREEKSKAEHCVTCLRNKDCKGIWQSYLNAHGGFELKPFVNKTTFTPSVASSPKFTIVELTKRCNLRCEMCYYKKSQDEKELIETEEFLGFITQLKKIGAEVLSLTGGEPFLRKDLPEIIQYAESIGLTTTIFTNSQLIDKRLAKKIIDSNLSYLFCSMDALTPELNNRIRGRKGVFEKTVEAINILNETRAGSNLKLGIGTVIMGTNLGEVVGLTKFAKDGLKVDHISYKPVQAHKLVSEGNDWRMVPREDVDFSKVWVLPDKHPLLDSTIDWIVSYKRKNKFIFDTEGYLLKIKQYFRTPYNSCLGVKCETCESTCIINSEAELIPCWGQFKPYGNINKAAAEAWDSAGHKELKKSAQFCELPCHNVLCNPIKRVKSYKEYIL